MGAEFGLTSIPLIATTAERMAVLRRIVPRLTKDDFDEGEAEGEMSDRFDSVADWVKFVGEAVEMLPTVEETHWRYVNHHQVFEKQPYDVLFTGGMMDEEDDLFQRFTCIRQCKPILDKLTEWAIEDRPPD